MLSVRPRDKFPSHPRFINQLGFNNKHVSLVYALTLESNFQLHIGLPVLSKILKAQAVHMYPSTNLQ